MAKFLIYLNKLASLLRKTSSRSDIAPILNMHNVNVEQWFKDMGDQTHRINYDLTENSIVFDLGGYEGQWANDIFMKYSSNMFVFEPFDLYAEKIKQRFNNIEKIKVFDFGLSNVSTITKLNINNDASSIFTSGGDTVDIKLVKADDFLTSMHIGYISLMKINIEGGEYDLLEFLIDKNFINQIENIQVQFHYFVPNAEKRMLEIQNQLKLTHRLTYQYAFVWENWTLIR